MYHVQSLKSITSGEVVKISPEQFHAVARDFLAYHGISRPQHADLPKIGEILQAFMKIPYENLSKIIKFNKSHLDITSFRLPTEVWQDFRRYHLGGTCFSLTFFLHTILDYCGYSCYPVMARMKAGPNHHCALVVLVAQEPFLVDPGYALDVPMRLHGAKRKVFRSAHAGVELVDGETPRSYHLYTFNRAQRQWRYEFSNQPTPPEAFLQHWLESFTWNGMHGLCLTRVQKDSLVYVHNYFMRETNLGGKKNFNLKENREATIQQLFGIPPETVEAAQAALEANLARERASAAPEETQR